MASAGAELSITPTPDGFVVEGDIDAHSAPALEARLMEFLSHTPSARLDLSNVGFMDSSGVRAIIVSTVASRERGGDVVVIPSHPVQRLFSLSGLDDHITVESATPDDTAH